MCLEGKLEWDEQSRAHYGTAVFFRPASYTGIFYSSINAPVSDWVRKDRWAAMEVAIDSARVLHAAAVPLQGRTSATVQALQVELMPWEWVDEQI